MAILFLFLFFLHMSAYSAQGFAAVESAQTVAKPSHVRCSSMPTDFTRARSSLGDISPPAAAQSTGAAIAASFGVSPRSLSKRSQSKPPPLAPVSSQQNSARDGDAALQTAEIVAVGLPGEAFRFNVPPNRPRSGSAKSDATHLTDEHSPTKYGQSNDQDRDGSKKRTEDNGASQEKAHRENIRQTLDTHSAIKFENLLLLKAGTKLSLQNYLIKCLEDTAHPLCVKYNIQLDDVIKGHIKALVDSRLEKIQFDDATQSPASKPKNLNPLASGPIGPAADKDKNDAVRQSWHQTTGSPPANSRQPTSTTLPSGSTTAGGTPQSKPKSSWLCCCCGCD